jgi:hypothetical protein
MTTLNTEINTITLTTLRTMRARLDEAAAIARAAEGWRLTGSQVGRLRWHWMSSRWPWRPMSCCRGLAMLSRLAREEQDEAQT